MKTENLVLIGGAALVAYFLLKKKAAPTPLDNIVGGLGDTWGAVEGGIKKVENMTESGIIYAGGQANKVLNPGGYSALGPTAGDVLANADFINQYMGSQVIAGSILPSISGSGLLTLRGGEGIPIAQAQRYIDEAVRAAPESYGVSLASGGVNVFNLTSGGTAATRTNLPTATNPLPKNFGSLGPVFSLKSNATVNLASLMARGL